MKRRALVPLLLLAWLPAVPAQASAPAVHVQQRSALCGGMTLLSGPHHLSCVHPSPDATQTPWLGAPPATAAPVCYGDGTTGPRVQLIYGYVDGQRDRSATVLPVVRQKMAPRMQAMVKAASLGKDLGIRFAFNAGCAGLSVPVVRFPAGTVSGGASAMVQFGRMISTLQSLGYTRDDRKYEVIWDWWNPESICGLGELGSSNDQPEAVNPDDGLPTVGGHTDVQGRTGAPEVVPFPRYSAVWAHAFSPRGPDCWTLDQSQVGAQVHELFHTLGAVQLSAPHSDGGGHCTDTPSVMCAAGRKPMVKGCATQPVQVLDCGMDDFWNPAPVSGSYLDKGPNIAMSRFFGPQPQDRLVGAPV